MLRISLLLTVLSVSFTQAIYAAQKTDRFVSPDGSIIAVVIHVGKESGFESYESRIELRNKAGEILCSHDYSSEDSEHGYGVAKALWTPDSQFFVYSLQSSGGHQPWHTPIDFFSRPQKTIQSLDDAIENAIADAGFEIAEPDKVTVTVLGGREITVRLSKISRKKHTKERALR